MWYWVGALDGFALLCCFIGALRVLRYFMFGDFGFELSLRDFGFAVWVWGALLGILWVYFWWFAFRGFLFGFSELCLPFGWVSGGVCVFRLTLGFGYVLGWGLIDLVFDCVCFAIYCLFCILWFLVITLHYIRVVWLCWVCLLLSCWFGLGLVLDWCLRVCVLLVRG